MKQQAVQYLALDVHQATVVGTLRDQQGSIMMRATVPTGARSILALIKSAGPRVRVIFEEGTDLLLVVKRENEVSRPGRSSTR
jgi:hypothetical protein